MSTTWFQQNLDCLIALNKSDLMLPRHRWFDGDHDRLHHVRFLCFLDIGGSAQIFYRVKLMCINYAYVHSDQSGQCTHAQTQTRGVMVSEHLIMHHMSITQELQMGICKAVCIIKLLLCTQFFLKLNFRIYSLGGNVVCHLSKIYSRVELIRNNCNIQMFYSGLQ